MSVSKTGGLGSNPRWDAKMKIKKEDIKVRKACSDKVRMTIPHENKMKKYKRGYIKHKSLLP